MDAGRASGGFPPRRSDRPWIVDGGLATGLESMGYRLDSQLWSARIVLDRPEAVERLHARYLEAGAEILISASYQMSFAGLARAGLGREAAADAMRATVELARTARDRQGARAWIAASVGPYGATRGDGSEYSGRYGLEVERLIDFHGPRLEVLDAAGADLLAIETIPSAEEARALLALLERGTATPAWVSFSCRDATHICDGTPIGEVAGLLDASEHVAALGVNCTAPRHVSDLMQRIAEASGKPIVVYPNSGESWDAAARRWRGEASDADLCRLARQWAAAGAWAVGGCCRIGPDEIHRLAAALSR